jgi:hypothetical protein
MRDAAPPEVVTFTISRQILPGALEGRQRFAQNRKCIEPAPDEHKIANARGIAAKGC